MKIKIGFCPYCARYRLFVGKKILQTINVFYKIVEVKGTICTCRKCKNEVYTKEDDKTLMRAYKKYKKLIREEVKEFKYISLISSDSESGDFIVTYPDLPGCIGVGATIKEAEADAEINKNLWIETAIEVGKPIPNPRKLFGMLTFI